MIKFVFIGGTYRGFRLLAGLLKSGYKPGLVYILKEDDHENMKYSGDMEKLCGDNSLEYAVKRKLDDKDEKMIGRENWDFAIICGWRTLINPGLNQHFKAGMIAAHDSLLPKYRGFAPLNWSIINGEKQTGVTLFQINEEIVDSGPVFSQKTVTIGEEDYAIDVFEKTTDATIDLYTEFLKNYEAGTWTLTPQDETLATYTCKRTPEDGQILWTDPSKKIFDLIRGLAHPFPGAYCSWSGKIFRIRKAVPGTKNELIFSGRIPGRVIRVSPDGIEVLCGTGSLKITEWETESGKVECPSSSVKSITATLK